MECRTFAYKFWKTLCSELFVTKFWLHIWLSGNRIRKYPGRIENKLHIVVKITNFQSLLRWWSSARVRWPRFLRTSQGNVSNPNYQLVSITKYINYLLSNWCFDMSCENCHDFTGTIHYQRHSDQHLLKSTSHTHCRSHRVSPRHWRNLPSFLHITCLWLVPGDYPKAFGWPKYCTNQLCRSS